MKNDALAIFLTSKKDLSSLQVSFQDFKKGEEKDKKSTRRMLCLLCLNKIKLKKGLSSTPNFIRTLRVKLFFSHLDTVFESCQKLDSKVYFWRENSNVFKHSSFACIVAKWNFFRDFQTQCLISKKVCCDADLAIFFDNECKMGTCTG